MQVPAIRNPRHMAVTIETLPGLFDLPTVLPHLRLLTQLAVTQQLDQKMPTLHPRMETGTHRSPLGVERALPCITCVSMEGK